MECTNGRALVMVPVILEPGDCHGRIRTKEMMEARKRSKRSDSDVRCRIAKRWIRTEDGAIFPRNVDDKCSFPDVEQVVPKTTGGLVLCLNPKLLADLAKAMGSEDGIKLVIQTDAVGIMNAMEVLPETPNGAYGVMMPKLIPR